MKDTKTIRQIILGIMVGEDFSEKIQDTEQAKKIVKKSYEIMDFLKTVSPEELEAIKATDFTNH